MRRAKATSSGGIGLAVALVAMGLAAAAQAAPKTYTPNKTADHAPDGCSASDCTLREAVIAANANPGRDTIKVGPHTYTLALPGSGEDAAADGDLDITQAVAILGKGASRTIVDGGGTTVHEAAFDVLTAGGATINALTERNSENTEPNSSSGIHVDPGAKLRMAHARVVHNDNQGVSCCAGVWGRGAGTTLSSVVLSRVVVADNTGAACCNGAIFAGASTLTHVTVRHNTSTAACCNGVETGAGTTRLVDVRVTNNDGPSTPAGCCNGVELLNGHATLRRVVITDNDGGCCNGFDGASGPARLTDVVIADNDGISCCQGLETGSGPEVIRRTTVSGHDGETGGCNGVCLSNGPVKLVDSTVSGNSAADDGGGITTSDGSLFMNNVTVTKNRADSDNSGGGDGGGIFITGPTAPTIQNSIIAGNSVGSTGSGPDCFGTINSHGHNLIGDTSGCTITGITAGNILNVNPRLAPLRDNGGFTKTHALRRHSKAIDHGGPKKPGSGGKACDRHDQRGVKRPQGRRCDIGAYEKKHRRHHHHH